MHVTWTDTNKVFKIRWEQHLKRRAIWWETQMEENKMKITETETICRVNQHNKNNLYIKTTVLNLTWPLDFGKRKKHTHKK